MEVRQYASSLFAVLCESQCKVDWKRMITGVGLDVRKAQQDNLLEHLAYTSGSSIIAGAYLNEDICCIGVFGENFCVVE